MFTTQLEVFMVYHIQILIVLVIRLSTCFGANVSRPKNLCCVPSFKGTMATQVRVFSHNIWEDKEAKRLTGVRSLYPMLNQRHPPPLFNVGDKEERNPGPFSVHRVFIRAYHSGKEVYEKSLSGSSLCGSKEKR